MSMRLHHARRNAGRARVPDIMQPSPSRAPAEFQFSGDDAFKAVQDPEMHNILGSGPSTASVSSLAQDLLLASQMGDSARVASLMNQLKDMAPQAESMAAAQMRHTAADDEDYSEAAAPLLRMSKAEHMSMQQAQARLHSMRADDADLARMQDELASRRRLAAQFPELAGALVSEGDSRMLSTLTRRQQVKNRREVHGARLAHMDALDCTEDSLAEGRKVLIGRGGGGDEIAVSRGTVDVPGFETFDFF